MYPFCMYGQHYDRFRDCEGWRGECCKWFLVDIPDSADNREFMKARGAKRI